MLLALWCNCYEGHQFGIFLVSRCVEGKTKAEIWALDTRMASWKQYVLIENFSKLLLI